MLVRLLCRLFGHRPTRRTLTPSLRFVLCSRCGCVLHVEAARQRVTSLPGR
jgi:hypothetical protein